MRELTAAEIESLASRPGVKRIAVENFLGTIDTDLGWRANGQNMLADARSYGWNEATVAALWEGLDMAAGYGWTTYQQAAFERDVDNEAILYGADDFGL